MVEQATADNGTTTELRKSDPPPENVPTVSLGSVQGVVISQDWTSNGKYEHFFSPEPIVWPKSDLDIGAVEINTPSEPSRTTIRYFSGELSANGVPTTEPVIHECVKETETADSGCRIEAFESGFRISFTPPEGVLAIIANVMWYVPSALRERLPEAPPVNTVAVGWTR